jgi:hypothetical protein
MVCQLMTGSTSSAGSSRWSGSRPGLSWFDRARGTSGRPVPWSSAAGAARPGRAKWGWLRVAPHTGTPVVNGTPACVVGAATTDSGVGGLDQVERTGSLAKRRRTVKRPDGRPPWSILTRWRRGPRTAEHGPVRRTTAPTTATAAPRLGAALPRRRPSPPAFALLVDLDELARQLEADARHALGLPPRHRGGSTGNTRAALEVLVELLAGLGADHPATGAALHELRRWRARALALTGHVLPWPRLTRHTCPYCDYASLRQRPHDGAVVCTAPSCRDDGGNPPAWTLEELRRLGLLVDDAPV